MKDKILCVLTAFLVIGGYIAYNERQHDEQLKVNARSKAAAGEIRSADEQKDTSLAEFYSNRHTNKEPPEATSLEKEAALSLLESVSEKLSEEWVSVDGQTQKLAFQCTTVPYVGTGKPEKAGISFEIDVPIGSLFDIPIANFRRWTYLVLQQAKALEEGIHSIQIIICSSKKFRTPSFTLIYRAETLKKIDWSTLTTSDIFLTADYVQGPAIYAHDDLTLGEVIDGKKVSDVRVLKFLEFREGFFFTAINDDQ